MSAREWVSDKLHDILGFSDAVTADYVVAVAKRSKSSAMLQKTLVAEMELPSGTKINDFAEQLFQKTPRTSKKNKGKTKKAPQPATSADLLRRKYTLLDYEDDPSTVKHGKKEKKREKKKKKKKKRKRKRQARRTVTSKASDSSDGGVVVKQRRIQADTVDSEEEEEKSTVDGDNAEISEELRKEIEREKDQREKDEFHARLLKKDDAKTRRIEDPDNDSPALAAALGMSRKQREEAVPALRIYSRQEYLTKRELKERKLLEYSIEDHERFFDGVKLSKQERRQHKLNKDIHDIASRQIELDREEDEYRIPAAYEKADGTLDTEKKFAVLTQRYLDDVGPVKHAQERWEELQMDRVAAKAAAQEEKQIGGGKQYEYVFEDQVEFITGKMMEGAQPHVVGEMKALPNKEETKMSLDDVRKSLPIYAYRDELLKCVRENQVTIIVGETGSGKTTQIPQYLHEAGYTKKATRDKVAIKVGCTQPRRVAAMSVAARVAQEMGCHLGHECGYHIRFEDETCERTMVKYMTDGMLLREFLADATLGSYSVIMVDEAHERSLATDVLFGLVKDIARFRDDIKLIISSATMDAQKFSDYFDKAPIFLIPGRRFPVDILYTKAPEADYLDAAVVTALQVHISQPTPGDVLIFLTGQQEIDTCEQILKLRTQSLGSKIKELLICPIYASLPSEKQAEVFVPTPENARKVVIATNIAETSLTIEGICFVIDAGFAKQNSYNPKTGMESLLVTPISKAGAVQRAGRAGRTQAGKCFRLYTAWSFKHELPDVTVPEIQRTNMASTVLMLKSMGIDDLINFDFLDPPPVDTLIKSLEQLYALSALNHNGELTKTGRRMAEFPCDPMLSKTILASEKYECVEQILTICSMLDVNNSVFYRPKDKALHADNAKKNFARGGHGDHFALLNVYNDWAETNYSRQWCFENFVQEKSMIRARDIREQFVDLCERVEIELVDSSDVVKVAKAITSGYFYHSAKFSRDGTYRTVKNPHTVAIHPQSTLFKGKEKEDLPRWVTYHRLMFTSKEYMRQIIVIEPAWLIEVAPHYYKEQEIMDSRSVKMPKGKGKASMDEEEHNTVA